ncbi:DUF3515 domain-containing protein [Mycobacterium tuberculosis]|uniref:DUF3515 domain-containing protein n=1 Tax=Mycobacterium tuberculosis TaxID=1773 RepID=UPI00099F0E8D|nr:DUF3515 domain-containing protein [Mycobacterium tuberculosis]
MTGESDGPPRAVLIAAAALAAAVIGVILFVAANRQPPERPVVIPAVPAPQATGPGCKALLAALPQRLGEYRRAPVAEPTTAGATAWRTGPNSTPVILRCGLDRPAEFVVGSAIQVVDRVQWFQVAAQNPDEPGRSTWYTVDRPVYVALTLPSGSGPTAIQELSDVIDHTIPAVPIDPAPAR